MKSISMHVILRYFCQCLLVFNMKAIAYKVLECEKRHLAEANSKVHDLTLISNELNQSTIHYSVGKEAVVRSDRDFLD